MVLSNFKRIWHAYMPWRFVNDLNTSSVLFTGNIYFIYEESFRCYKKSFFYEISIFYMEVTDRQDNRNHRLGYPTKSIFYQFPNVVVVLLPDTMMLRSHPLLLFKVTIQGLGMPTWRCTL